MRRDLFVTQAMLQEAGLTPDVRLTRGSIEVRLGENHAIFTSSEADKAADWLARCAVINYPESEFAQLWLMLAAVSGGAIPFGSR